MALPPFKDEAEFRENWIRPFLAKRGYILVTHTHGTSEHGKDLIFADFDGFEHPRFYSAQAKNGNIGAGGTEIGKLLEQVKASFEVRIRDRKGADEQRVSAVYVMASGKISDEARRRISEHCRAVPYGENVYFLDGDRLETLERSAQFGEYKEMLAGLTGLRIELDFNIDKLETVLSLMEISHMSLAQCRLSATDALLAKPLPEDILPVADLQALWSNLQHMNALVLHRSLAPRTDNTLNEQEQQDVSSVIKWATAYRGVVQDAIGRLQYKYGLEIDVPEDG